MPFLQLPDNFGPKDFDRVAAFVEIWTYDAPLAMEFRHTGWYNDAATASRLYDLLEAHGVTNVLVDAAGRRDLMHMRLTTSTAFVRWVGANVIRPLASRRVGRTNLQMEKGGVAKTLFLRPSEFRTGIPRTGRAFHRTAQ